MEDEEFQMEPVSIESFYNGLVADTDGINLATDEGKKLFLNAIAIKIVSTQNNIIAFQNNLISLILLNGKRIKLLDEQIEDLETDIEGILAELENLADKKYVDLIHEIVKSHSGMLNLLKSILIK
jgi:hypothetical protein